MDNLKYLTMDQLADKHTYIINARNAFIGVWIADEKKFLIPRYKIGWRLCYEYHWDTGEPYGTARPYRFLEKFPVENIPRNHAEAMQHPEKENILNYLIYLSNEKRDEFDDIHKDFVQDAERERYKKLKDEAQKENLSVKEYCEVLRLQKNIKMYKETILHFSDLIREEEQKLENGYLEDKDSQLDFFRKKLDSFEDSLLDCEMKIKIIRNR